jgi:hypothetical protein
MERRKKVSMSNIKHLERDLQNINDLSEHGPFCECIWCIVRDTTEPIEVSDPARHGEKEELALTRA